MPHSSRTVRLVAAPYTVRLGAAPYSPLGGSTRDCPLGGSTTVEEGLMCLWSCVIHISARMIYQHSLTGIKAAGILTPPHKRMKKNQSDGSVSDMDIGTLAGMWPGFLGTCFLPGFLGTSVFCSGWKSQPSGPASVFIEHTVVQMYMEKSHKIH